MYFEQKLVEYKHVLASADLVLITAHSQGGTSLIAPLSTLISLCMNRWWYGAVWCGCVQWW